MALKKSTKDPLWNNIFQQGFCEKSEDPWKIYSKSNKKSVTGISNSLEYI